MKNYQHTFPSHNYFDLVSFVMLQEAGSRIKRGFMGYILKLLPIIVYPKMLQSPSYQDVVNVLKISPSSKVISLLQDYLCNSVHSLRRTASNLRQKFLYISKRSRLIMAYENILLVYDYAKKKVVKNPISKIYTYA